MAGNDTLLGNGDGVPDGMNTIYGGAGNDWIAGDDNNDLLYGDDGGGIPSGLPGDDTLNGGKGMTSCTGAGQ